MAVRPGCIVPFTMYWVESSSHTPKSAVSVGLIVYDCVELALAGGAVFLHAIMHKAAIVMRIVFFMLVVFSCYTCCCWIFACILINLVSV